MFGNLETKLLIIALVLSVDPLSQTIISRFLYV